jgi:hypothetical protein
MLLPASRWAVATACFLSFATLTHLSFTVRPDAMALMLMMSGFYLFNRYYVSGKMGHLLLSGVVLAVAFFAKQDAMVVIAPLSLLLLLQRKWKHLIAYDVVFLLSLAGLLSVGHMVLGEHFLRSVVMGVQNPPSLHWALYAFARLFTFYGVQFILGVAFMLWTLKRFRTRAEVAPLAMAALFYLFFGFVTSFKTGAGMSYYTPFLMFVNVLTVVGVSDRLRRRSVAGHRQLVILGVLVISGIFLFRQAYHYTSPFLNHTVTKAVYMERWEQIGKLKDELGVRPTDRIFAPDPLTRLLLASNSVMPNMEFYGISPFDYDWLSEEVPKPVEFVVMLPKDAKSVKMMMDILEANRSHYAPIPIDSDYTVLARTDWSEATGPD